MDDADRFIEQVENSVQGQLRSRIARHQARGSSADRRTLLGLAESDVEQWLDGLAAEHAAAGRDALAQAFS